jgi:hypothetical protein
MITLVAHDLCWINDATEDPQDQCAHGTVEFRVNDTTFVKPEDGQWTVSGAALFLLRTLSHDHTATVRVTDSNFLFPCCANTAWPDDGEFSTLCVGCNTGIDIEITHQEGAVRLTSPAGTEVVSENQWRLAVLGFAEQVLDFYKRCAPKADLDDDHDRQGWTAFWQEWKQRVHVAQSHQDK